MINKFKHVLSCLVIAALIFCSVPNIGAPAYAASIKLNKSKATLYIGKTTTLKLKGTSKKVTWSSSNKKIATVSKKGKVVAKRKGTATIKAKVGKKTYKCKVTVKNKSNAISYDSELVKNDLINETNYDVVQSGGDQFTIIVPSDQATQSIKKGDVIMMPSNDEYDGGVAMRVSTVSTSGNEIRVKGEAPDFEEVFDQVKIAKTVTADINNLVLNEDVVDKATIKTTTASSKSGDIMTVDLNNSKLVNGSINGSIDFEAPIITADIDVSVVGILPTINKLNIDIENKAIAKVEIDAKSSVAPIYLGCIPNVSLGNGFFVDVVFYVNVDANGHATVQCTVQNNSGITYSGGSSISPYCNFTKSFDGTKAEIDAKLLISPQAKMRWGGIWDNISHNSEWAIQIVGLNLNFGPGLHAEIETHDVKPFICNSLDVYAYLDLGLVTEDGLGMILKKLKIDTKWVLLDNDSENAIKTSYHFEDGKLVPKCTYDNDVYKEITFYPQKIGSYYYKKLYSDVVARSTQAYSGYTAIIFNPEAFTYYTNGKKIFTLQETDYSCKLVRYDASGKNKKSMLNISVKHLGMHGVQLFGYRKGFFILNGDYSKEDVVYSYNIEKNALKTVAKNCLMLQMYENYAICCDRDGGDALEGSNQYLYSISDTCKMTKLKHFGNCSHAEFFDGEIYYCNIVGQVKKGKSITFKVEKCNIDGTNNKLVTSQTVVCPDNYFYYIEVFAKNYCVLVFETESITLYY